MKQKKNIPKIKWNRIEKQYILKKLDFFVFKYIGFETELCQISWLRLTEGLVISIPEDWILMLLDMLNYGIVILVKRGQLVNLEPG